MSQVWLVEFCFWTLVALLGGVAGWWLRGRPAPVKGVSNAEAIRDRSHKADRKALAEQALESLHAAAETVRSCVQQHIDCIQAIRSELKDKSATEPAIITSAAASIIAANGLVQHQLNDIQRVLDSKQEEINDCLAQKDGLFFTFASLDRQKHIYKQVLSSLELLAAELAKETAGHGQRIKRITDDLRTDGQAASTTPGRVNDAIAQIFDATADIQNRVEVAEKTLERQADAVNMQAVLTHTDLLTSLPNRRAFESELQRFADGSHGRGAVCTVFLIDLDRFGEVNTRYGHQGGDLILRQAAAKMKQLVRGKDLVARYGGDSYAVLISQSTLHDALPVAERIRSELEQSEFSHGNHPLRVTASVGIAQLRPQEPSETVVQFAGEALRAAMQSGGNLCFRHDGRECFPVSSVFNSREQAGQPESQTLASMWRESTEADPAYGATRTPSQEQTPVLSGRSLFMANLSRRMAEWKRGGAAVSVVIVRVDQIDELVGHFGPPARGFVHQVLSRLLEAATREMDERCEFEDGVFAILLPGTDEVNAFAVAERLGSQVRQCKVRIGADLWDLTASIGVAHCTMAFRVMDLVLSAEGAMKQAVRQGGDVVCVGEPVGEESPGANG